MDAILHTNVSCLVVYVEQKWTHLTFDPECYMLLVKLKFCCLKLMTAHWVCASIILLVLVMILATPL